MRSPRKGRRVKGRDRGDALAFAARGAGFLAHGFGTEGHRFVAAAAAVVTVVFAGCAHPPAAVRAEPYATCGDGPKVFVDAAAKNAQSIDTLDWTPFGPHEKGWAVYEILIGQEIGTTCGAGTAVFAQKLADFQTKYQLAPDGVFSPATFEVLKGVWQERRPFVMLRVLHLPHPGLRTGAVRTSRPYPKDEEAFDRDDRARCVADAFDGLPACDARRRARTTRSRRHRRP